ncbi:DUF6417 family protein [Streptomyces sp. NPDC056390]|uniref:DUF6417 family protein n=1 Tax=Streptomyces sp. NPDC056390 TaxID=3345806 RepID=UPI0035DFB823
MYSDDRLPVLTLDEAHDVLNLLTYLASLDDEAAEEAQRLARELAARVPSREDDINEN